MPVTLDGKLAGQTGPHTFFLFEVAPGRHEVSSVTENTSTVYVTAEAGKAYFVWQEVKMGMFAAGSKLQEVDDATGRKGVAECKRAQPNF